jgi:two-component system CheB/CheR fusion protein
MMRVSDRSSTEAELRLGRRHVHLHATVVPDSPIAPGVALAPGASHLVLLAIVDVTERRSREEALAQVERALRDANRRKDEFLAALSHELRNPLAPISSSLFVLGESEPGGERSQNALGIISRQVSHLSQLVDQLLDVTRIVHGKIQLERKPVELTSLVRGTLEDHRRQFEGHGVAFESSFEPGPLWVDADPGRLVQVLSNLLGNAAKFTNHGGRVTVALRAQGRSALLSVRDTGVGISPGLLEHVFEPFTQAPQTIDRAHGGLGLGLALVKGLVDLHGGRVTIASAGSGCGTEVVVTLPLDHEPKAPAAAPRRAAWRARRVLLIEDNPDAAASLAEALELCGHEVRATLDGASGIAVARSFRPEVVICDIGLPGMNGYDVARVLRAEPALSGTCLVALTGYAAPDDIRRVSEAGFARHLRKPAKMDELDRLVSEAQS